MGLGFLGTIFTIGLTEVLSYDKVKKYEKPILRF